LYFLLVAQLGPKFQNYSEQDMKYQVYGINLWVVGYPPNRTDCEVLEE